MQQPPRSILALLSGLAVLAWAGSSLAQGATERIGDFKEWSAYRSIEQGSPVCFMASEPTADKGNYTKRGDIFALVSHRPSEKRRDEVSFVAGYVYKEGSNVEVKIGGDKYQLRNIEKDGAWTASPEEDQKLVKAMIKGKTMTVIGTSSRGTLTTDTYSLSGFTKAYNTITQSCGL